MEAGLSLFFHPWIHDEINEILYVEMGELQTQGGRLSYKEVVYKRELLIWDNKPHTTSGLPGGVANDETKS